MGRPRKKGCYIGSKCCADAELYTLTELHAKMVEFSGGYDVYTLKRLKQKLHEHYDSLQKLRGVVLYY